jgi:rubrerythrin
MSEAFNPVSAYGAKAEEYRRLAEATTTEALRNQYERVATLYRNLAESEKAVVKNHEAILGVLRENGRRRLGRTRNGS